MSKIDLTADLEEAACEEAERACQFTWRELTRHMPWGDVFEGYSPKGREVRFERNYLWDGPPGGDILVEVHVYQEGAYERGVRVSRWIRKSG